MRVSKYLTKKEWIRQILPSYLTMLSYHPILPSYLTILSYHPILPSYPTILSYQPILPTYLTILYLTNSLIMTNNFIMTNSFNVSAGIAILSLMFCGSVSVHGLETAVNLGTAEDFFNFEQNGCNNNCWWFYQGRYWNKPNYGSRSYWFRSSSGYVNHIFYFASGGRKYLRC